MIIKKTFKLISNTPNVINLGENIIRSFYDDVNNPKQVFAFLDLKKKDIIHFTNDKIFDLNSNDKKRDTIQVINFDYPLPATYNIPTKGLIINLNFFEIKEISSINPIDLYASIVYAYIFEKIITKKYKISESYIKPIVNFFLSFYVKAFGRKYGLVGTYSSGIPKLKFLIACYILAAYFGYKINDNFFIQVSKIAPYNYFNEINSLKKYNFQEIDQFIKAVSDLKVMPGFSITSFTSALYRFYGVTMLAAIEDCARFFSVMLTSSIPGAKVVPRHIVQVNKIEYFNIVNSIKRELF